MRLTRIGLQSLRTASLAMMILALPVMAHAIPIPIAGVGTLGSFTGDFDYTATDDEFGTVTVNLTNTSAPANSGFITAFVFNIPTGATVTLAELNPSVMDFDLLGGPSFVNDVNGAPYGQFDIGAALGGSFQGGGTPQLGIGVGGSLTFVFELTGSGLGLLTAGDFLSTLSVPPGAGEGTEEFVVRFKGFQEFPGGDDSDKVPAGAVPEPATGLLLGLGAAALAARRRRRHDR